MNDILSRIRRIFSDSGKSQTEIGKMIGKTPQYVWRILNVDDLSPSESVIRDICREFDVNEDWLRTGIGKMYKEINPDDRYAANIGKLQRTDNETIIRWVNMIAETNPEALKEIEALMKKILNIT